MPIVTGAHPHPSTLLSVPPLTRSKLFKEYAIADLSRYKEGRVGLRWRTQKEVVSGRGQFVCGAKVRLAACWDAHGPAVERKGPRY